MRSAIETTIKQDRAGALDGDSIQIQHTEEGVAIVIDDGADQTLASIHLDQREARIVWVAIGAAFGFEK